MIEAYQLSKVYSRGVYALRDFTLSIGKGEFLFITGPSGSGKSTLLRLLLREDLPTSGSLKVGGHEVQELRGSQIQAYRRTIGFVFQDFRLVPRFTSFKSIAQRCHCRPRSLEACSLGVGGGVYGTST